jgi:hypothetical protein
MSVQAVSSPTKAEIELLRSWRARLDRLYKDVTGQMQALACFDELVLALNARRSRYVYSWVAERYTHSAAIGVRRVFRDGRARQNVSLERLLTGLRDHSGVLLRHGNASAIRRWLESSPTDKLTDNKIRAHINDELGRLRAEVDDIKRYADTIAHLQKKDVRVKIGRIRATLRTFVRSVATCYAVLGDQRPFLNEDAFIVGFERELASPRASSRPTKTCSRWMNRYGPK